MERFILELFIRGAFLCLLTATALILIRRSSAAYRHLLCVLALCGLLALPLAQRIVPPLRLLTPRPASLSKRISAPVRETSRPSTGISKSATPPMLTMPQDHVVQTKSASPAPHDSAVTAHEPVSVLPAPHRERAGDAMPALLLSVWGVGVAVLLIRLLVALVRLRRLEAESRQVVLGGVPVRVGERVTTPVTWGIRRRVVLLPASLLSGDPAVCESALRHEQAHIVRGDWAWNLLAEIVCAVCWFQPGAWWLRRRMRLEAERACDDLTLLSGISAPDYAAHLLEILRSAGGTEVAPAMAQSGSMEERMTHILDAKKPRRAGRTGLILAAQSGFALLALAAIRVDARPAAAKPIADRAPTVLHFSRAGSSSQALGSASLAADSTPPRRSEFLDPDLPSMSVSRTVPSAPQSWPMALALPGAAPAHSSTPVKAPPLPGPVIPVDRVVWGKAVDGLEPGFLLNSPGLPNQRAPFNSRLVYQVLVRNTTRRNVEFMFQVVRYEGFDPPYLIPSDNINEALDGPELPDKFRAQCGPHNLAGVDPAYVVSLAPGEAVLAPGPLGLFLGDKDSEGNPCITKPIEGMNWILQPITIHALTPSEIADARSSQMRVNLTVASHDGRAGQRSVALLPARNGDKRLYAKWQIEVGTLDAEAVRNAGKAVWGKVDKGLQCGIRLLNPKRTYRIGDTLEAETLWRNASDAPINNVLPRPLDLYPSIHNAAGNWLQIDFGARFELIPGRHTYEPGEIHSLGVTKITLVAAGTPSPKSNMEPGHITLEPGTYRLTGSGGVSAAGAGNPNSGEIEFRVVGNAPEAAKEEGVFWGEKAGGFQLGARIVPKASVFKVGDTIKFQTFGRNLSGKASELIVGNYWKVNYKVQVQTFEGKPIYMERDRWNQAKQIEGYLDGSLGNGVEQEISEAALKIIPPRQKEESNNEDADVRVEAVPLKPGRYRVRIVSSGIFGPHNPGPASAWIPIEVH